MCRQEHEGRALFGESQREASAHPTPSRGMQVRADSSSTEHFPKGEELCRQPYGDSLMYGC